MEYLVSAKEMKEADRCIIEEYGVPSLVLMERAALACVKLLEEKDFDLKHVLIASGSGNNGGDGFVMARLLFLSGVPVDVWFLGEAQHLTKQAALQKKICENYGINFVRNLDAGEYTTIVDAIFGSGLSRDISGNYWDAIEKINKHPAKVFSVDIPSGIRSDDGEIAGISVRADVTGALAFRKIGHVLYPGSEYSGEVVCLDIGITKEGFGREEKIFPSVRSLDFNDLSLLPKRGGNSNKGSFGKSCVIAGSKNMAGAAYLAGKAAYLTGTGLVRMVSDECNRNILQTLLPEAVLSAETPCDRSLLSSALAWASAAAIGPGLSTSGPAQEIVRTVLELCRIPLVLDADAINILSGHLDWLNMQETPKILTPHMGEMSRLTGLSIEIIQKERLNIAKAFAREHHVILVLKDARTLITDGDTVFLNQTGNNGMSTGGSGDVLTGIITGLLSQGMNPLTASALGVYIHGLAGDQAAKRKGVRGMLSTDLLETLPLVLKEG